MNWSSSWAGEATHVGWWSSQKYGQTLGAQGIRLRLEG